MGGRRAARHEPGCILLPYAACGADTKRHAWLLARSEVHIADADAFTREWAAGQGLHLAPARVVPPSPIEEVLAAKSKPSGAATCWGGQMGW